MALPRPFFAPSFRYRHNGLFFAILVGALVYLATFVAGAEMALFGSALSWDRGLTGSFTVEIPPAPDESATPEAERLKQALAILRAMPGVASATAVPEDEALRLLKPWITSQALLKTLPVPTLIDVERAPGSNLSADDIQRQLKITLHDVHVDDHAGWLADLGHLVRGLALVGVLVIALTALTLVIAVSLLCRAIMAAERDTIELLHIMGAADNDIARQFQFHARFLAAPGSCIGFICALFSVMALVLLFHPFGHGPMLRWFDLGVVLVPLAAVGIAAFSARLSVLNFLYTMP